MSTPVKFHITIVGTYDPDTLNVVTDVTTSGASPALLALALHESREWAIEQAPEAQGRAIRDLLGHDNDEEDRA